MIGFQDMDLAIKRCLFEHVESCLKAITTTPGKLNFELV